MLNIQKSGGNFKMKINNTFLNSLRSRSAVLMKLGNSKKRRRNIQKMNESRLILFYEWAFLKNI